MEYRFTEESLRTAQGQMKSKGLICFALSLSFLAFFVVGLEWYFSILPSTFLSFIGCDYFLYGRTQLKKYRDAMVIKELESGISISVYSADTPFFIPWGEMTIAKEHTKNGILTKFTINTGDRYIKSWEFSNDIEGFSTLYKSISHHGNT
ncbi:MAG: hypothetical protein COA90_06280 [Gammaproteobacteria bacterium]|nr:MAG: hypothetical protein COA90_06280 [Gammaproteobacteria bacterium]